MSAARRERLVASTNDPALHRPMPKPEPLRRAARCIPRRPRCHRDRDLRHPRAAATTPGATSTAPARRSPTCCVSLELPAGARVAAQTDKSVEALLLYLAVLRAGYVYLPLNTAYQAAEIEYFIGNAEPSVVVCVRATSRWVSRSRSRPARRTSSRSSDDRSGSLLERAALAQRRHTAGDQTGRRAGRHPLHQRHHRAQQGRDAEPRQPAVQRAHPARLLGLAVRAMC